MKTEVRKDVAQREGRPWKGIGESWEDRDSGQA
jgi:hypothetical protein